MTIRFKAITATTEAFDEKAVIVQATPEDAAEVLQCFSLDELIAECSRRHREGYKQRLVPVTPSIFFETNPTDFKVVEEDK